MSESGSHHSALKRILTTGEYFVTVSMIPIVGIVALILHPLFFFVYQWFGYHDSLLGRLFIGSLGLPLTFYPRQEPLGFVRKAYYELFLMVVLPGLFTILLLHNDLNTYSWVTIMWAGLVHGLASGKIYFPVLLYPLGALAGSFMFLMLGDGAQQLVTQSIPVHVIAWLSALIGGFLKVGADVFYLRTTELETQRIKTQSYKAMKEIAEEKLETERQLAAARKMEIIGNLAGGVAHDFNNQLTGIIGAAQILQLSIEDPEQVECIDAILTAGKRSADLTHNLLSYARSTPSESTPVDLHQVIEETVRLLRRSIDKRVAIETDFRARQSWVLGDSSLLQNSLLNLCVNASHAMAKGGTLSITTENGVDTPENQVAWRSDSIAPGTPFLQIQVSDTGMGMDRATQERIFEPFFTTRHTENGTGMGLAMVHGTVKSHQGCIDVASSPGEGTTFTICFPVSDEDGSYASANQKIVRGEGSILLIDDDDVAREIVARMLRHVGYTVVSFGNPGEALSWFSSHVSDIDLVITDMVMPGMLGSEVFEKVRHIDSEKRVLLISGYYIEEALDNLLKQGALGILRKPFTLEQLSSTIAQFLHATNPRQVGTERH